MLGIYYFNSVVVMLVVKMVDVLGGVVGVLVMMIFIIIDVY